MKRLSALVLRSSFARIPLAFALAASLCAQDATKAERLFREGSFEASLAAYGEAAELADEGRGALMHNAGVAAMRSGKLAEAVWWFERAVHALADPAPSFAAQQAALRELDVEPSADDAPPVRAAENVDPAWLLVAAVVQAASLCALLLLRTSARRAMAACMAVAASWWLVRAAVVQLTTEPSIIVAMRDAPIVRAAANPNVAAPSGDVLRAGSRRVALDQQPGFVRIGQDAWVATEAVRMVAAR